MYYYDLKIYITFIFQKYTLWEVLPIVKPKPSSIQKVVVKTSCLCHTLKSYVVLDIDKSSISDILSLESLLMHGGSIRCFLASSKVTSLKKDWECGPWSGGFIWQERTLEESLSITTGRCDLAIATHARKMHKKISIWLSIGVF